jgi:septum formation inhibitor MinC
VVAKEQIQESKAQAPQADTKSDVRIEGEEKQQIREEVAKEKQQIREEGVNESITPDRNVEQEAAQKHVAKPVNDEGKESPRDTSGDEFVVKKTEDKKFVTPSMEMLQEKLQAISEVSESDASTEKPVEQKRPGL